MVRIKRNVCFLILFFIIFGIMPINSAFAQDEPTLFGVFPEQGGLGMEVYVLLQGDGFDALGNLDGVVIYRQEIPVHDYVFISNQRVKVWIFIPENTPVGKTEITFLFGAIRLDAYFMVMDDREEISPQINQVSPQEGQVDSNLEFIFRGERLFEMGNLGGLFLGEAEIPVKDSALVDDSTLDMQVYLPPDIPPGETEISLFFQNSSFVDRFHVLAPEPVQPFVPYIIELTPRQGILDTDTQLLLKGANFDGLGNLINITIAGVEIPVINKVIESNESMIIDVYLPPYLPAGDTDITVRFENSSFESIFFLRGPEPRPSELPPPVLREIIPQEADVNSEVELTLLGENLLAVGDLLRVEIAGVEIPIMSYVPESNERLVIRMSVPVETPHGDQTISLAFENAGFEDAFLVKSPRNPWQILILIVVGGGGGLLVIRLIRKGRPPTKKVTTPAATVDFKVSMDSGIQNVEIHDTSKKLVIDIYFEIEQDLGDQSIEFNGNTIINHK